MRYLTTAKLVVIGLCIALAACSSGGSDGQVASSATPPPNPTVNPPQNDPPFEPVSALYILGDSLSDVGNAAALVDFLLNRTIQPPAVGFCNPTELLVLNRNCEDLFYRRNRVSDGAVAVEFVAAQLGFELLPSLHLIPNRPVAGTNYAFASAKARSTEPEDLGSQLDWLLLDAAPLPPDALFVVMIGGNDLIDALQAERTGSVPPQETSSAIVASAVAAIGSNIERLLDFGARRLIVANVPDLSALPDVREEARLSADEAGVLATAAAISESFNNTLDAELDRIESRGIWDSPTAPVIMRFDLRGAIAAAQQMISAQGGNSIDPCFDSAAYRDAQAGERSFHPECEPTSGATANFDNFAFWDGIHPTGAAHLIIGMAMFELL